MSTSNSRAISKRRDGICPALRCRSWALRPTTVAPALMGMLPQLVACGIFKRPSCGMTRSRGRCPAVAVYRASRLEAAQPDLGSTSTWVRMRGGRHRDHSLDRAACVARSRPSYRKLCFTAEPLPWRDGESAWSLSRSAPVCTTCARWILFSTKPAETSRPPLAPVPWALPPSARRDRGDAAVLHAGCSVEACPGFAIVQSARPRNT